MGEGPSLEVIMRLRESLKPKLTPRFQQWWDEQIEKKKREQGGGGGGGTSERRLSLAEEINQHRQQEVRGCFLLVN